MKIIIFLMLLQKILLFSYNSSDAEFLKINTSAVSIGIGGGGIGLIKGLESINVASVGEIEKIEILLEHGELYNNLPIDVRYENIGLGLPFQYFFPKKNIGCLIFRFLLFNIPEIEGYDDWGGIISKVDFGAIKFSTGYAISIFNKKELEILSGLELNYIKQKFSNLPESPLISFGPNYSIDIGTKLNYKNKYNIGFIIKNFSFENIGEQKANYLPTYYGIGFGYLLKDKFKFNLDFDNFIMDEFSVKIGIEYNYNLIFFRVGSNIIPADINETTYNCGLGVKYKIFYFNYAFMILNPFGTNHRFSITLQI